MAAGTGGRGRRSPRQSARREPEAPVTRLDRAGGTPRHQATRPRFHTAKRPPHMHVESLAYGHCVLHVVVACWTFGHDGRAAAQTRAAAPGRQNNKQSVSAVIAIRKQFEVFAAKQCAHRARGGGVSERGAPPQATWLSRGFESRNSRSFQQCRHRDKQGASVAQLKMHRMGGSARKLRAAPRGVLVTQTPRVWWCTVTIPSVVTVTYSAAGCQMGTFASNHVCIPPSNVH